MAHCEKDLLVLFGGEYFDGKSTEMFNDVILYNIKVSHSSRSLSSVGFSLLQAEARNLKKFMRGIFSREHTSLATRFPVEANPNRAAEKRNYCTNH